MASTTLMTFLVQAPRSTVNVKLLGSWDNFTRPYPMQQDARIGQGHWRGCHSFTDIICDGDSVKPDNGRDGGLKMGGTYWYYYELNGDIEFHNPAEPSTTSCPLLPGQVVNILEVPVQLQDRNVRSHNSSTSSLLSSYHYTLNPDDKYLNPKPTIPMMPCGGEYSTLLADDLPQEDKLEWATPTALDTVIGASSNGHSSWRPSSSCYNLHLCDSHSAVPESEPSSENIFFWATVSQLCGTRSAGDAPRMSADLERPVTRTGSSIAPSTKLSRPATRKSAELQARQSLCVSGAVEMYSFGDELDRRCALSLVNTVDKTCIHTYSLVRGKHSNDSGIQKPLVVGVNSLRYLWARIQNSWPGGCQHHL